MSTTMNDVFDSIHPHDVAGERPAGMSDLLDDHSVVAPHEAPGASSKAEYAEEEPIDTEPLPHSPAQNSPQTNTMDQQPQATVHGDSYPAMVHGSPIGHKDHSAVSTAEYDVTHHHHHAQNQHYGVPMMWGAEHGVLHPGDKPKRPLSAYNFFFQLERERIINGENKEKDKEGTYTVEDVARIALIQQRKAKENKPKPKRSHRKTHGKISFGDLARTIANKWKKLDDKSKAIFEGSASIEKERYKKELAEWTKKQKKWKEATTRMTLQNASGGAYLLPEAGYGIVTPTQLPKKTVASAEVSGNSPGQISTASAEQHQWGSQQQQQHRFSTGADYPQDMYNSNETDYMNDNGQGNQYDYEDVTNETYNMAQMTLPQQPRPNAYQQRMIMQQHRMRMVLMQQRQNMMRQQMMMRQGSNGSVSQPYNNMEDFDHQSLADDGNYMAQQQQQQQHTGDGGMPDDASTFMDSTSQGILMNSNGGNHDMSSSPSSQHNNDAQILTTHHNPEDDFQPFLHHGHAPVGGEDHVDHHDDDDDFHPHPLNHQADSTADEFTPIML